MSGTTATTATMTKDQDRDQRLRRTFAIGLVICLLAVGALGVVIKVVGTGVHRPEGAAERWLNAVGDTTRNGVRGDARKRAAKIGPLALAAPLLPAKTDGKRAFPDLEVGKARTSGDQSRVPYRLHQYVASGDAPVRNGVVILNRTGGEWHVTALGNRQPGERVPSEGGDPPSRAPAGIWLAALVGGIVITAGASLLVRWATRSAERAGVTNPGGAPVTTPSGAAP
jgi:hypothetical protein